MIDDPQKIMVAGDWHGNEFWAVKMLEYGAEQGADVCVHVGDFGFWRDNNQSNLYLKTLEKKLNALGIMLYWVDGNHEDHDRIARQLPGRELTVMGEYPHIIHLPRGFRWNWWGQTWMALGGAYSVDRHMRVKGKSWWPEETLSDEDIAYAKRDGEVNIIVAHDAPFDAEIPGISKVGGPSMFPPEAIVASEYHRLSVQEVYDAKKPSVFIHGHYHRRYVDQFDKGVVIGLDCDGSSIADNLLFLNKNQ